MSDGGILAKGEGRKEGREAGSGKREGRDNLEPMDWPTRKRKSPKGIPWGVN